MKASDIFEKPDKYFAPPPTEAFDKAYRLCKKMIELDPGTMAEVMAWNNMSMESDLPEDEELQKKWIALKKEAEWEIEEEGEL